MKLYIIYSIQDGILIYVCIYNTFWNDSLQLIKISVISNPSDFSVCFFFFFACCFLRFYGWPGIHYVAQAGLELRDLLASAYVFELKVYTTIPGKCTYLLIQRKLPVNNMVTAMVLVKNGSEWAWQELYYITLFGGQECIVQLSFKFIMVICVFFKIGSQLCSPGWPQDSEIHLPLLPQCWD